MQTKRLLPALASLLALLPASGHLWALGLGPGPQSVLLGQPLDITVPVRLESGETLGPECVSVEVQVGDQRLDAAQLRTRVDAAGADQAVIRVLTSNAIDEPIVTVSIAAGCSVRVSRRFEFIGLEKQGRMLTRPAEIRKSYLEEFGAFLERMRLACERCGATCVRVTTDQPWADVLTAYLATRQHRYG